MTRVRVATLAETLRYGQAGLPAVAGGAGIVVTQEGNMSPPTTGQAASISWNPLTAVPAGDLAVGCGGEFNNGHVPVFTDSAGNTYGSAVNGSSGSNGWGIAHALVSTALTTADTFTETGTSSTSYLGAYALDVAGATNAPYAAASQASASTTAPSLSTSTAVDAGDLVVAYSFCNNAVYNTTVAGFTVYSAANASINDICAWTITGSAGVVTFSPTTPTAQTHLMAVVAFPAAGKPQPPTQYMRARMRARR